MNPGANCSREVAVVALLPWTRRAEPERIVYADERVSGDGSERNCVIVRAIGLWVRLDRLELHTREELDEFRALLIDAWYESGDLAASADGTSREPYPASEPLKIEPTYRELVLRTRGSAFCTARDVRRVLADLRDGGKVCWQS